MYFFCFVCEDAFKIFLGYNYKGMSLWIDKGLCIDASVWNENEWNHICVKYCQNHCSLSMAFTECASII